MLLFLILKLIFTVTRLIIYIYIYIYLSTLSTHQQTVNFSVLVVSVCVSVPSVRV